MGGHDFEVEWGGVEGGGGGYAPADRGGWVVGDEDLLPELDGLEDLETGLEEG